MRRLPALAILCALLVLSPAYPQQTSAPAPGYDIEMLVFRVTSAAGGAEDWSAEARRRSFGDGGEAGATTAGDPGRFLGALAPARYQLGELAAKLRASGRYELVAHTGWSQTASPWGSRAGFSVQRLGMDVPGLTGLVSLERGRFLHLGLVLDYAMASPPAGLGAAPGTTFTLSETRRIRFGERHYFDHPAFGVIAIVTPAQSGSSPAPP